MRKRISVVRIVALVLSAGLTAALADQPVEDEIARVAGNGIEAFLASLPAKDAEDLGIPGGTTSADITVGKPFLLHRIAPAALEASRAETPVTNLIEATTQYYVPVTVAGTARALLIVDRVKGQWKAVSLGYPAIAREMQKVIDAWPESKGCHPVFVVMPQAHELLFTIPGKGNNLSSLQFGAGDNRPESARQEGEPPRYGTLTGAAETVRKLKQSVAGNTAARKTGGE